MSTDPSEPDSSGSPAPTDDAARRAYWSRQMDEAYDFMLRVLDFPVRECGERLAPLPEAARDAGVEATFSDLPHVKGLPRLYVLREGQIDGFVAAAREMNRRGWVMHVEDGLRTRTMQKFVGRQPAVFDQVLRKTIWELGGETPGAEFLFRRLSAVTATRPKIGTHMSGSAIDISVRRRDDGTEVDRGGPYIEMSERTPMASPFVGAEARRNREAITTIMRGAGFVAYPWEFWHYNGGDAYDQLLHGRTEPARYGAIEWDPTSGAVTPIADPAQPLSSLEEIQEEIEAALARWRRR